MDEKPYKLMLFDMDNALHDTIEDLMLENFPGPTFTNKFLICSNFKLFFFKKSNIIMLILSKFSLVLEYSLV